MTGGVRAGGVQVLAELQGRAKVQRQPRQLVIRCGHASGFAVGQPQGQALGVNHVGAIIGWRRPHVRPEGLRARVWLETGRAGVVVLGWRGNHREGGVARRPCDP